MTWATTAAIAISTAISAATTTYVAVESAKQQKEAAKANNDAARKQANNAELENAEQIRRGQIDKRKQMAAMRNQLANSGVLATEGTPLSVLGEASANMDLAMDDAKRQTTMQADALRYQGKLGLWEADGAMTSAVVKSVGAFANAAGSTASTYGANKKTTADTSGKTGTTGTTTGH